jgi:lipopolysaccharide export system protein LptC
MSTFASRNRQDRLAALFPLLAVGLFALLTFWLDARVSESARSQKNSTQSRPDHFLEGFKIERTAVDGRVESVMLGARATHFPNTQSTVVDQPRYASEVTGKPKLEVAAARAILLSESAKGGVEQVDFSGTVRALQAASPGRDAVSYESEQLTVFPKTQLAKTDSSTRTVSGDRVMTTEGLRVNADKKQGQTDRGFTVTLPPKGN